MTPYKSITGKQSGVTAYEIGKDFILVKFYAEKYLYTYASAGSKTIETMKSLALASSGLSSYKKT
jgi:hypothetical protein